MCPRTRFSLEEILVLADTAGAGSMAPTASTKISARKNHIQEHSSLVTVVLYVVQRETKSHQAHVHIRPKAHNHAHKAVVAAGVEEQSLHEACIKLR